ncbi:hypothetical protein AVEN_77684-2-1, partial [Araneus ventricosus]
ESFAVLSTLPTNQYTFRRREEFYFKESSLCDDEFLVMNQPCKNAARLLDKQECPVGTIESDAVKLFWICLGFNGAEPFR